MYIYVYIHIYIYTYIRRPTTRDLSAWWPLVETMRGSLQSAQLGKLRLTLLTVVHGDVDICIMILYIYIYDIYIYIYI